ncbi:MULTISPECIES: mannitol dehydrogenase family protein [unclassified Pseudonocardia]|uniref:mannitol dehydrogenase family protein n=1 Tax=unclassified Pseudonocardia TaxID=2619320 RepID=UPI000960DCB8|nr:mannitol dehydrogenase family protein [Pseudonocardia sp. Ae707_Ps1]OLM19864.1 D-mannonate oxidoreductase [Pseudonocardia sp. Ae707_Ps1]
MSAPTTRPALGRATLARVPADARPAVDPGDLRPRVLHLGLGAFHRAHQAPCTERAAAAAGEPWGVAGVAPRSADVVDGLRAQDHLYSLTEHGAAGPRTAVVGSVVEALRLGPDAGRVSGLLADPDVTVVTLTLTEKGYRRGPGGGPDTTDPDVAADLAGTGPLRTPIGALAAGLARRMRDGGAPISVVSCDNTADNGAVTAAVVRGFVAASAWPDRDRVLAAMDTAVTFPATVVDRIVPATTDADRAAAAAALGTVDAVPVTGESYLQWVVEDRFAGPRPRWELAGAELVGDVAPFQLTKLRLLNGAHSALAYLGLAAGVETVADTMATHWGAPLVRALATEVAPTLPAGGPDPAAYADALVARFGNPGIRHRLRQIGSDGSQKIAERWFPVLRAGGGGPVLRLALAGWVHATRPGTTDPAATVRMLLDTAGAPDLAADDDLVTGVAAHLPALGAGRVEL